MRLCRIMTLNETVAAFYLDDRVIPIHRAVAAHRAAIRDDLGLGTAGSLSDDLLDYLPPAPGWRAASTLAAWVDALDPAVRDDLSQPTAEVHLTFPIAAPPKILLLAGNYAAHVIERGGTVAEREETFPYVFMKPTSTLIGAGDPIVIPPISPDHIDWEAELGVVIGEGGQNIPEESALAHVAGYTIVNDISDRKFTPNPGRKPRERDKFFDWLHGKWHDTFCPMGPCITSADAIPDPQSLAVRLTVNGDRKQDGNTGQMIFPVAAIIAFISRWVTLEPGDIISTGTPSGVGSSTGTYLRPGDTVVATIDRIGALSNPVVAAG